VPVYYKRSDIKTAEIPRAAPLATEIANHRKFQMISRNCLTGYFWEKNQVNSRFNNSLMNAFGINKAKR
jgi:hypothetical protein